MRRKMTTEEFIGKCRLALTYELDDSTKDFYVTALELALFFKTIKESAGEITAKFNKDEDCAILSIKDTKGNVTAFRSDEFDAYHGLQDLLERDIY